MGTGVRPWTEAATGAAGAAAAAAAAAAGERVPEEPQPLHQVGWRKLMVSKPVLKARLVSALETETRYTAFNFCFQIQLAPLQAERRGGPRHARRCWREDACQAGAGGVVQVETG